MSLCHRGWEPLLTVRSVSGSPAVLFPISAISIRARLKEQVGIIEDVLNHFQTKKIVTSKIIIKKKKNVSSLISIL